MNKGKENINVREAGNEMTVKSNDTGELHKNTEWDGIQEYFRQRDFEKKGNFEEYGIAGPSRTYIDGNKLVLKRSSSDRMHEYVKNRWDGIQQYFRERDREKNEKLKENTPVMMRSAHSDPDFRSYCFSDNSDLTQQLRETTDLEAKKRFNLLSAIKHRKERLLKNQNSESRVIYFDKELQTKASFIGKMRDSDGNRWSGIQQYFQVQDHEKKEELEENVTSESIITYSEGNGNELVTRLSMPKKLRENARNTWIGMLQYFSGKNPGRGKRAEEHRLGESSRFYYGQRVSNYDSTGSSRMNPQILETAEEEIYAKKCTQLATAKYNVRQTNDGREKAFENASRFHNGIAMLNSEIYSQNQMIWGTEDLTGCNLEGIWKVKCELRMTMTNEYEFRWKVKLKLKPARKFISMIQSIPTSSKIQNLKRDEVSDVPRKYKIIFIGDSGVGKTSFIRRYCNNSFKSSFHSTVGVDYREKMVNMNGESSVLQLWDTAGQERFRSMCLQYFRNSDAVIAIYDVTSEKSFKNIRGWMDNIKETTDSGQLIMLIGNKIDAIDFKLNEGIRTAHGALLAEEYDALFFETSVKYDENVTEAMTKLIKLLEKRVQQERKQLVLEIEKSEKKCC